MDCKALMNLSEYKIHFIYFIFLLVSWFLSSFYYNKIKNSFLNNEEPEGDQFEVLSYEESKNEGLVYFIIKKIILFDLFYFKNCKRTHVLLIRAAAISFNLVYGTYLLTYVINMLGFTSISDLSEFNSAKFALAYFTVLSGLYWNLRNDQSKKFNYCLNAYNNMLLATNPSPVIEVTITMDILTMDLWSKRILSPYFSSILLKAIRFENNFDDTRCIKKMFSTKEAFVLLKNYAEHLSLQG